MGLAALACMTPSVARGDDLAGKDKLVCSAVEATVCTLEGSCEIGAPWNWDIPQFLEIDLRSKQISTTAASGQNRVTTAKTLERAEGLIVLQGLERGRAFSIVITEGTGRLSAAVARDQMTVTVFGACTPLPS
jgi:hypothetical protein